MTSTVLDSVLQPFADCLTVEAAQQISSLRADDIAQERLDELADKANDGLLSLEERSEYDQILAAFHLITILQAKARHVIRMQTGK